jgi:cell division protease FtsH
MVLRWGMSDKVGNIDYAEAAEGYTGQTAGLSVSANTKELIEEEVRSFIQQGYEKAREIILERNEEFERLAQGLLEYETLTGDEITKVINGLPIAHEDDDDQDAPDQGGKAALAAIPKTKKQKPPKDPGMEPEPST